VSNVGRIQNIYFLIWFNFSLVRHLLVNVEKCHLRLFSIRKMLKAAFFQHSITFEKLNQIKKTAILKSAHLRPASSDI